ncbi:hypothetical protein OF83DRAFT_1179320 [Amylostereum chailletii]|nr:hypothetical protein OF83DRAFT_1179320 [Amylostereum chailletii]
MLQSSSAAAAAAILLVALRSKTPFRRASGQASSLAATHPRRHPPLPPPTLAAARPPPLSLTTIRSHPRPHLPSSPPSPPSSVCARYDVFWGPFLENGLRKTSYHVLVCICNAHARTPRASTPTRHTPMANRSPAMHLSARMPARMPCTCTRYTRRPAHNARGHSPACNAHNTHTRPPARHAHPHARNTPPHAQCIPRTPHAGDPHAHTPALNAPTRTRRAYPPCARPNFNAHARVGVEGTRARTL